MKRITIFLFIIAMWLGTAVPLLAQSDETTGRVTGQIVNQTPEGVVPGNLELMLHAWDEAFTEKLMLNGQADANGFFQFEDVTLNPDWLYAVMLTYEDVLYFSEPMPVVENQAVLNLEVSISEVTTDTSQVRIERQHVFFDAAQDGLQVGEIYVLSNLGDETVAGLHGDDAQITPLHFALPDGATNVTFVGDEDGRYLLTSSGFADTVPLRPGIGQSQVVVQYVLPYADGLAYSLTAQWPVVGVNFLLPETLGLSLVGEGLVNEGEQDMGNGQWVTIYTSGALETGDTLAAELKGTLIPPPPVAPAAPSAESGMVTQSISQSSLALGGVLLGLALIVVGIWWHKRLTGGGDEPVVDTAVNEFDALVVEIARLDEAHDLGELDDDTYQLKRTALRQQAASALRQTSLV